MIKDLTNCVVFLGYAVLSIILYLHPQYRNMMWITVGFSIIALCFIFFGIFTYDNQSYKVERLKVVFFSIMLVSISVFFELIKEFMTDNIYNNFERVIVNLLFFMVSFVLALIIRKQPLIVVLFAGVYFLLTVFGHSFGGLLFLRKIARRIPVYLVLLYEKSLFNILILFFMVTAILYFLKKIID